MKPAEESCLPPDVRKDLEHEFIKVKTVFNEYYESQKKKAKKLGLKEEALKFPDTMKQQKGLAAALASMSHPDKKELIAKEMEVTVATVNSYMRKSISPKYPCEAELLRSIKPNGRPSKYPLDVDIRFIEWAQDEENPLNRMTMDDLMDKYIEFLKDANPSIKSDIPNLNGIRQHIYSILKLMHWSMIKPVAIDLQRCAIYDSMVKWFKDPEVQKALTTVHPLLLINADETQISLSRRALKKVLWRNQGKKSDAVVPAGERESNHISLFVAVSAAGEVMKPNVLIHEKPKGEFSCLKTNRMVCYHAPNGFMTYDMFYRIMRDVFVKHIENVRRENGLEGRKAVLVVDGHVSRFTVRTVELLMKHNIDLVILPSHTSHVTQPLDIGLNRWIKQTYQQLVNRIKPVVVAPKKNSRGRPRKQRHLVKTVESEDDFEKRMREENERLLRARQEGHESMMFRVGNAPYKRVKIYAAVIEAVASLTPLKIQNAWNASHLYPFYGTPNYTRSRELKLLHQIPKEDRLKMLRRMVEAEMADGTKLEDVAILQYISKEDREALMRVMLETQNVNSSVVQVEENSPASHLYLWHS